ncbi:hypothetical protein GCM10027031_09090 [Corynebacterium atrinae]
MLASNGSTARPAFSLGAAQALKARAGTTAKAKAEAATRRLMTNILPQMAHNEWRVP